MSVKQQQNEELNEESDTDSESSDHISISQGFKYTDSELKPVKSMAEFHQRFSLGPVLGGGGDGDVFEDKTKSWPAIKKIDLLEFQDIEHEIKRAQQEQRLLAKGKIANIYGIYYDKIEHVMYKIYDRYNYALDDIVNKLDGYGMTEYQTKYIAYNICKDIKKLHAQSFIHCDVKPSNILYCKKGTYKAHHNDKQTFKVIDYDGIIWNQTQDVVCTHWQGSLPFSAPEMNDYSADDNNIGYGVDIWNIGLLIIYMINGGHLGLCDISDDDHKRFYQDYEEEDETEIKSSIFDVWYTQLFGPKLLYQKEIEMLYKRNKISSALFDLLFDGILVKNPEERMNICEVLQHEWFTDIVDDQKMNYYCKNVTLSNGKVIDLYDGIMSDDLMIKNQVILLQIVELKDENNDSDTDDSDSDSDSENESDHSENESEQNDNDNDANDEDEQQEEEEESPEIRYYSDENDTSAIANHHEYYGNSSHENSDNFNGRKLSFEYVDII